MSTSISTHMFRDWSLITYSGEGGGGIQNGKIAGSKLFKPPPQDRVKLFAPPPLVKGGHFLHPPSIWLTLH